MHLEKAEHRFILFVELPAAYRSRLTLIFLQIWAFHGAYFTPALQQRGYLLKTEITNLKSYPKVIHLGSVEKSMKSLFKKEITRREAPRSLSKDFAFKVQDSAFILIVANNACLKALETLCLSDFVLQSYALEQA